jgi:hypothetical protein
VSARGLPQAEILTCDHCRWQFAGRMWCVPTRLRRPFELMYFRDMLANLASVSKVPLPGPPRGTGQKRTREPEHAAATDPASSLVSTQAQGPWIMAGSQRIHAYPFPPLEPAPVFAAGAPSFSPAQAAEPGTSLGLSAQGPVPPGITPSGGWAHGPASLLSDSGDAGEHVTDNSALPAGTDVGTSAPVLGDAGEQLAQWWADADPGATAGHDFVSDGTSGADIDAIGEALDALLSQSGHGSGLPGNDPLALWTQTPMDFG